MKPRSKYNSLNNIPDTFTKEEWELAVSVIDFLPHDILVELNNEYGVKFEGGNDQTDDENLINALLGNDISKDQTMEIAHKYKDTLSEE